MVNEVLWRSHDLQCTGRVQTALSGIVKKRDIIKQFFSLTNRIICLNLNGIIIFNAVSVMVRTKLVFLCMLVLAGCKEKTVPVTQKTYPVYQVNLDSLSKISIRDLFSGIQLIPLQKKKGYKINAPQFGLYQGNYYLWDDEQKSMFCFGPTGKFKYVTKNDKLKSINRNSIGPRSKRLSIMDQLGYRYNKQWYLYQTFRTEVYHLNKEGAKTTAYRWDFGKYNDKDTVIKFDVKPLYELAVEQQKWLHENSAFALSEAKENQRYIYAMVERIYKRKDISDFSQFVHLFYEKSPRDYKLFSQFDEGTYLPSEMRMNDTCMMALVDYSGREWFVCRELLDDNSLKVYKQMKKGDYPLVVKYIFK